MADQDPKPHAQSTEARRAAARAASRRWRERNGKSHAPRRRQLDRERYAANRESVLAAKRERYASDPDFAERLRGSNNAWYERNRERRREYNKSYRREHGDELRARERARPTQVPRQSSCTTRLLQTVASTKSGPCSRVRSSCWEQAARRGEGRALHIRGLGRIAPSPHWSLRLLRIDRTHRSRPSHPTLSRWLKRDQQHPSCVQALQP